VSETQSRLRLLIDDYFTTSFSTENALVNEAVRRMLTAGGKRLRPQLTLLAAEAVGARAEDHVAIATHLELIHVATLIHDDIVDGADERRGVTTVGATFGNRIGVLAGDYLFAWIFATVTANYPAPIPHILSRTLAAICDGEVLQLRSLGDLRIDAAQYTTIVAKKTASLFAAAAECGARCAGADPRLVPALTAFGEHLGIAFQILDDILDLTGDHAIAGKPIGHDLIEGKVTLPLIMALETATTEERAQIAAFFTTSEAEQAPVVAFIHERGGIEQARRRAERCIEEAEQALAPLTQAQRMPLLTFAQTLLSRPPTLQGDHVRC